MNTMVINGMNYLRQAILKGFANLIDDIFDFWSILENYCKIQCLQ